MTFVWCVCQSCWSCCGRVLYGAARVLVYPRCVRWVDVLIVFLLGEGERETERTLSNWPAGWAPAQRQPQGCWEDGRAVQERQSVGSRQWLAPRWAPCQWWGGRVAAAPGARASLTPSPSVSYHPSCGITRRLPAMTRPRRKLRDRWPAAEV